MRVPYYFGDPKRDPNLENYPHKGIVALRTKRPLKVAALYPYTMNPYMVYEP